MWQALITTATGLALGAVCLLGHHFLVSRVQVAVHEMEWLGSELLSIRSSEVRRLMTKRSFPMKLSILNLDREVPRTAKLGFWPFVDICVIGLFASLYGSNFVIAPASISTCRNRIMFRRRWLRGYR